MAGRRAGPRNAGDYSIDLHIGINGISGAVWYCKAWGESGTRSEHVADFGGEAILNEALAVAVRIIRLDRNGRQAQVRAAVKGER